MTSSQQIDDIDRNILEILSNDGRISWRDLATAIGLSLTPTLRRVRRLEEDGYIEGYHAAIDETRLGGEITVFISVTLERQKRPMLEAFEKHVATLPEIIGAFMMTGQSDYLLKAVAKDLAHYSALLDELAKADGVAHIHSSIVLKAFVKKVNWTPGTVTQPPEAS